MTLTKQMVYLPQRIEDKLPEIETNTGLFVMSNQHGWDKLVAYKQMFIPKGGYYLSPQEGYFFTPQDLNNYTERVIKESLKCSSEEAEIVNKAKFSGDYNPGVDEESILNLFDKIFNKFKV